MAAPKTVITYDLDGSNKDFQVPFEYLARKFVVVTLIGTDRKVLTLSTEYRFTQRTIITTTQSWGPAEGYERIEIRRMTSATERLVDFSDGSVLRAYDLNISNVQSLHIAEEGRDIATDTIGVDNDGNLDARGRRIVNLADAISPDHAVTLRQELEWSASTLSNATNSAASAQAAKTSETNAKASENAARQSATSALNAKLASDTNAANSLQSAQEARASELAAKASESAAEAYEAASFNSATKAKESEIAAAASAASADATLLRQQLLAGDAGFVGIKNGPVVLDLITMLRDVVDARSYGVEANTSKDNASSLAALAAFVRSKAPYPPKVIFPSGIIRYSESPNFAISNSYWAMNGPVLFYYTGTGDALRFDGQNSEGNVYNMTFERCMTSAPANAGFNVYTSSLHHSQILARVVGGGAGGWKSRFSVCSTFDVQVTKNGLPNTSWMRNAQPQIGFTCDELNPGELLSYCTFPRPIIEHCVVGVEFKNAFGNAMYGGTSEGHSGSGIILRSTAFTNKFHDMDLEENHDHDFYIEGRENSVIDTDTTKQITIAGGASNMVRGGYHRSLLVTSGAAITKLHDFVYNRDADGGSITDSGIRTNFRDVTNRGTSEIHDALSMYRDIALTGSPVVYINTTGNDVLLTVTGSGVSAIEWVRPSVGNLTNVGSTQGQFRVRPGDRYNVYYSSASAKITIANT